MSEQQQPPFSNYPRQNFVPQSEFDRPPGVHFDALGDSWKLMTRDMGKWIGISLAVVVLSVAIYLPFVFLSMYVAYGALLPTLEQQAQAGLSDQLMANAITMLGYAAYFPITVGMMWAALKQIRGEPFSIGDIFAPFKKFPALVAFALLYSIAMFVGLLLCIVPFFYVFGAFSLAGLLIVDRNMGVVEAMGESRRALGNGSWSMSLFLVVLYIVGSLGACLCGIGMVFTYPLIGLGTALHYHYFFGQRNQQFVPQPFPGA